MLSPPYGMDDRRSICGGARTVFGRKAKVGGGNFAAWWKCVMSWGGIVGFGVWGMGLLFGCSGVE